MYLFVPRPTKAVFYIVGVGWSAANIVDYRLGPCVFAGFEQEPTNEQPNP